MNSLELPHKYNEPALAKFFEKRAWTVSFAKNSNISIVNADPNAAIECGDGRFGEPTLERKLHGPKVFGGINGIALLLTGGDLIGFNAAANIIRGLGYSAGTHGAEHPGEGCGLYGLWKQGKLTSSQYPLMLIDELHSLSQHPTEWIKKTVQRWGGKHFTLPGNHEEKKLVINPYNHLTPVAHTSQFSFDLWVLQNLGISQQRAALFAAETVEQLTDVRHVEIIR